MEEIDNPDPAYVKGFNQGYLIAKEMPELVSGLSKADGKSPQLEGIKNGIDQFEKENSKAKEDKIPDWMRRDGLSKLEKDNSQEIEKNKNDLEKE